jgi:hypothetical protein
LSAKKAGNATPLASLAPREVIERKIFLIRGKKVMLDRDLAALYGVETRALNQAVRRNIKRFPEDFMFRLMIDEADNFSRSQIVTSSWGGARKPPYAFTEPGVAMLSSVLKSEKAIQVNILIIRMFIRLREILSSNSELSAKIELLERKFDNKFKIVFDAIREIKEAKKEDITTIKEIGFKG